jgi:hypothetical protein
MNGSNFIWNQRSMFNQQQRMSRKSQWQYYNLLSNPTKQQLLHSSLNSESNPAILVLDYLVLSDITKALRQHKERITPLHLTLVCPTQRVAQCSGNRHCHCITNLDVPASIRINRKQMFSFSLQFTNKFDCSKQRHILLLHWTIHPIVIRESLQPCVFTNS